MVQVKEWWIPCDCRCSVVNIRHADEEDGDETYLSIYEYGWKRQFGLFNNLKWKFRYIRKILKDGHPYSDSVVLDSIGRDSMIDALIQGRKATSTISTATMYEVKEKVDD